VAPQPAAAGPIGFVSLMMPHIARWMVGPDQRWIIPFSFILTTYSAIKRQIIIGRVIVTGVTASLVVTAFIGAPILIICAKKRREGL